MSRPVDTWPTARISDVHVTFSRHMTNWTYIGRSCDVQHVLWMVYARSVWVLCTGTKTFYVTADQSLGQKKSFYYPIVTNSIPWLCFLISVKISYVLGNSSAFKESLWMCVHWLISSCFFNPTPIWKFGKITRTVIFKNFVHFGLPKNQPKWWNWFRAKCFMCNEILMQKL